MAARTSFMLAIVLFALLILWWGIIRLLRRAGGMQRNQPVNPPPQPILSLCLQHLRSEGSADLRESI